MNKHRAHAVLKTRVQAPKHRNGWNSAAFAADTYFKDAPLTPGKPAKPFAKHHPATPITEATPANVTPLFPAATVLDVAA